MRRPAWTRKAVGPPKEGKKRTSKEKRENVRKRGKRKGQGVVKTTK